MSDVTLKVDMYPHDDVARLQSELTAARDEAEKLRGRMSETSGKADALSYALVHSMTDKQMDKVHKQFCELQDCLAQNSESSQHLHQKDSDLEAGGGDE